MEEATDLVLVLEEKWADVDIGGSDQVVCLCDVVDAELETMAAIEDSLVVQRSQRDLDSVALAVPVRVATRDHGIRFETLRRADTFKWSFHSDERAWRLPAIDWVLESHRVVNRDNEGGIFRALMGILEVFDALCEGLGIPILLPSFDVEQQFTDKDNIVEVGSKTVRNDVHIEGLGRVLAVLDEIVDNLHLDFQLVL